MTDAFDSLLESPDSVNPYSDENKVLEPLLEELDMIANDDIKFFCRSLLLKAGDAFWIAPFSPAGEDLPPDELEEGGNITHIKRVVRLAAYLAYAHELDQMEFDYVVAAALLHTITKVADVDPAGEYIYDVFHPYTVGPFVLACMRKDESDSKAGESSTLWVDEDDVAIILRLIRCQKGPWSIVPETQPIDTAEWIIHQADYISSCLHRVIDGENIEPWRWQRPKE